MNQNLIKPFLVLVLIAASFYPILAAGQVNLYPNDGGEKAKSFQGFIGYNSAVRNDPNKPYEKGTCYLFKEWKKADVVVTRDTTYVAKNIYIRIDILNNILEVNYFGQLNLLPFAQVHSIVLKDEIGSYITNNALNSDAPRGVYELLVNADNVLLNHLFPQSKSKKTNLDRTSTLAVGVTGESGIDIIIDHAYYGVIAGEVMKLQKQRKRFIYQFEENADAMNYIKTEKVNPRNRKSLTEFFIYLNSM